jgi:hypothetical protein
MRIAETDLTAKRWPPVTGAASYTRPTEPGQESNPDPPREGETSSNPEVSSGNGVHLS